MKIRKFIIIALVAALGLATTYSTTTYVRGWNSNKVYTLAAQEIDASDQIDWIITAINDNPSVLAMIYATGDSTAVTLDVDGTVFDPSKGIWEDVASYSVSGATVDTTYMFSNKSTSAVAYYAYRFRVTAGDTTTVQAAVKLTD